ATLRENRRR
ncbi:hypothetical protein D038_2885B, partial [Vibrio parahaemolyticus IDH02189]